jgi:hypothetical protein
VATASTAEIGLRVLVWKARARHTFDCEGTLGPRTLNPVERHLLLSRLKPLT